MLVVAVVVVVVVAVAVVVVVVVVVVPNGLNMGAEGQPNAQAVPAICSRCPKSE